MNKNPLEQILELIPYLTTILDPKLLDSMQAILSKYLVKPNNNTVIKVLESLHTTDYITMHTGNVPEVSGKFYLIKRNP